MDILHHGAVHYSNGSLHVEAESQNAVYINNVERHTAANIADRLSEVIKEWGIQVFCTVHDNASNMNLAMELCEMFPKDLGCTGHSLQLAIKKGLVLPDIAKIIDSARRVLRHFRLSALANCALKNGNEQINFRMTI